MAMPMPPKPAPTMVTDGVRALDANGDLRNGLGEPRHGTWPRLHGRRDPG